MIEEIKMYKCVCNRCSKTWITRKEQVPKKCTDGKCRRKDWNKQ